MIVEGALVYVWHEPAPLTPAGAAAKVEAWRGGDRARFSSHLSIALLRAELLAQFPDADLDGGDAMIHASGADPDVLRQGAKRHGLVCFDERSGVLDPNAPGYLAPFTLSSARLAPVADPPDALLRTAVRSLDADNFFAVLERADGAFVQAGYGRRAGAADDTYALEFQEQDRQFRAETRDVREAVRLFEDFRTGDDAWRTRHAWRPLEL